MNLREQIRSVTIKEECKMQDVVRSRRREWRNHVDRIEPEKLAKWAKLEKPNTKRPPGKSPKR